MRKNFRADWIGNELTSQKGANAQLGVLTKIIEELNPIADSESGENGACESSSD